MDDALTPRQEEYFRILAQVNPSPEMQRIIEDTKRDMQSQGDNVHRGLTRVKGFQPND